MTPFFIEPNRSDAMRARMDEYGNAVRELAQKYDAALSMCRRHSMRCSSISTLQRVAWDRVHPTQAGHMIIARAFLKALDFSW